jgi:hypothetical protein
MRTEADLRARVSELKQHFAPFLQNLTPPLPHVRPRQDLRRFLFRFEEPADRGDARRPYETTGDWEEVTIPHFRGPVGRWAAYYRTTFQAQADLWETGRVFLVFRGVDYRCQVFLNGVYLGSHEGFFAPFEFDGTGTIQPGENTLLVRVENDFPTIGGESWGGVRLDGDKLYAATGPGWDEPGKGWSHCPPGAGIFQPVYLESRPPVFLSDLWVRPDIDRGTAEARVEVTGTVLANTPVSLILDLYPRNFTGEAVTGIAVEVPPAGPGPNQYKIPLELRGFRLWAPEQPFLYTLRVALQSGESRDARDVPFGMRKFHMDETGLGNVALEIAAAPPEPRGSPGLPGPGESPAPAPARTPGDPGSLEIAAREFAPASPPAQPAGLKGTLYLNNRPIFLRGSNTMGHEQRCVMEGRLDQLVEDVLIYKAAHFNFLRITQRPVQDEVYDLFDALGMLHQCDFPLFGYLRYNQMAEAVRQAGELERLIRRHPSAILVSFINEPFGVEPGTDKAARMLDRRALEGFFAAATALVHAHNPDRVVKPVDGDYDPPAPGLPDEHCYCLWYNNHGLPFGHLHQGWLLPLKPGWRGGCGEYGIEGLDSWETMRARYPCEWIPESPDEAWDPGQVYGCQTASMHGKFFDPQETLAEWVAASQRHQAWGLRQMTDAFRRRADILVSTAVHLGIDAWPAGWLKCIVSVDRRPKPAYFTMADALSPLAANLHARRARLYGGEAVEVDAWVLNDLPEAPAGLCLAWWVEWEGETAFSQRQPAQVGASGAFHQGRIAWQTPAVDRRTPFAVCLALVGADGKPVHQHRLELEAFAPLRWPFAGRPVGILGQAGGVAWRFALQAGLEPISFSNASTPGLLLADSPAAVEAAGGGLAEFLARGGRLLCLEQETDEGAWRIAGREVRWQAFDPAFFASRKTGHPAVQDLQPCDLACWYDPGLQRIEPTFHRILEGDGLEPVAFTTTPIPPGTALRRPARHPVAADLKIGQGRALFTQVEALRRCPSEPLAGVYLKGLVEYLTE